MKPLRTHFSPAPCLCRTAGNRPEQARRLSQPCNRLRLALAALVLCTTVAQAAVVTTFATGQAPVGAVDPHYQLILQSSNVGPVFVLGAATQPLINSSTGPWMPNSGASSWVAPASNAVYGPLGQIASYETHFDMTGFDITTANFAGRWAAGDFGSVTGVLLNGVPVVNLPGGYAQQANHSAFSGFGFSAAGLNPGNNSLQFLVSSPHSDFNGLRVEYSGTAKELPEPASLPLMAVAAVGLLAATRRRPAGLAPEAFSP